MLSLRNIALCLAALAAVPIAASPIEGTQLIRRANADEFNYWLYRIVNDGDSAAYLYGIQGSDNGPFLAANAESGYIATDIQRIVPNTSGTPKFSSAQCTLALNSLDSLIPNSLYGILFASNAQKAKFKSQNLYNTQKQTLSDIRNALTSWQAALCTNQCNTQTATCNDKFNKIYTTYDQYVRQFNS